MTATYSDNYCKAITFDKLRRCKTWDDGDVTMIMGNMSSADAIWFTGVGPKTNIYLLINYCFYIMFSYVYMKSFLCNNNMINMKKKNMISIV